MDAADLIVGNTEMAKRIRAFAWETTSLGPISGWSPTLLNTVNLALAANFPAQLLIGPEFVLIHNDEWLPLLMEREKDALGRPGAIFWSEVWALVVAELEGVLGEGKSTAHQGILLPVIRHGHVQDVYWDYTYNPIYAPDGTIIGVLNISQDVTERYISEVKRKEAEVALQSERGRLLNVLHQAPIFFALLEGPQHTFTMANPLYMQLIGNRPILGKTVAEALPEAVDQGYVAILDKTLASGVPFVAAGASFTLVREEGHDAEERILDFTYQPMREPDGTVSGIIVIGVDITERKRAENALVQNEKLAAVGRLAASIAHEINNPLEAVTNLLYLARNTSSDEERAFYLSTADEELQRVAAIANQTLRFHKQASRGAMIACESLVDGVVSIYRGRMVNANVELVADLDRTHSVMCFDGEIRQVISNLIGNAVDAMAGHGGRLLLRTRNATDWSTGRAGVRVTVADTGMGIPQKMLDKIFEPFFTTKGIAGTGLGLWISRDIVARHKGRLSVRSSHNADRSGTVFSLFLPR